MWRGICYKGFNTVKTFSEAATACREDGGTLTMPQDADTNDFLVSLYKSVSNSWFIWIGLHRQRAEGSFEWVDGSALGDYNSWAPGEPSVSGDCVGYSYLKGEWFNMPCHWNGYFICQVAPGFAVFFCRSAAQMHEQVEPVRTSGPGSGQTSGPPSQPPPVHQPKGASDQQQQDQGASPNTYAEAERVYYTIKDEDLPPSFVGWGGSRSHPRGRWEPAGRRLPIGVVPAGVSAMEISELTITVDALKRDLDSERNLSAALVQCLQERSKTPGK
uniref:C-type lectin domain-containing protein n=1 Tax=Branchiostoma floridae TaxID=7739 RepID=C3XY84_BRAFL|eukprot:XP_002610759.1 hypothetical protein BRAFLDRAFT_91545 [Branchiostoma floridae]